MVKINKMRIAAAFLGFTESNGGLNTPDIKRVLRAHHLPTSGSGSVLRKRLKALVDYNTGYEILPDYDKPSRAGRKSSPKVTPEMIANPKLLRKASGRKASPIKGRRSPAKRSPAKRSPAKRSPAKRSPAKRSPAKQSPAKRSPSITVKLVRTVHPDTLNNNGQVLFLNEQKRKQLNNQIPFNVDRFKKIIKHVYGAKIGSKFTTTDGKTATGVITKDDLLKLHMFRPKVGISTDGVPLKELFNMFHLEVTEEMGYLTDKTQPTFFFLYDINTNKVTQTSVSKTFSHSSNPNIASGHLIFEFNGMHLD